MLIISDKNRVDTEQFRTPTITSKLWALVMDIFNCFQRSGSAGHIITWNVPVQSLTVNLHIELINWTWIFILYIFMYIEP